MFTNFSYDNIGVPANPANPFYTMPRKWNATGADWMDFGLGGYLQSGGYPAEVYEMMDRSTLLAFLQTLSDGYFNRQIRGSRGPGAKTILAGSGFRGPQYRQRVHSVNVTIFIQFPPSSYEDRQATKAMINPRWISL